MIHMMLADFTWPEGATLACTVLMCLATLYLAFSKKSQKREVTMDPGVATREELDSHIDECKADRALLRKDIDEAKSEFRSAQSQRGEKIYGEIKQLRQDMNDADTATREQMSKGFQDIERAMGRIEGALKQQD